LLPVSFTSSWLSTFSERAIRSAISPMRRFSSAVLTGPRRVTPPSMVMIFTFGPRIVAERSHRHPAWQCRWHAARPNSRPPAQILPSKSRTTRITRTKPSPPVGPYPQFRLCGQVGRAPSNIRTSRTTKTVPYINFLSKCEWIQPTRPQRLCARLMALSTASSMEVIEVPVSSMSLQMWSFMFGSSGIRASIARNVRLLATAGGAGFLDRLFDRFAGFARALLNPANKFFLLAFGVLEIVIRELSPLLLQLAFGDVPVAFDFECGAGGAGFLDRLFDRFPGFAGALLNPANKFFLLAFGILEIAIRELGPLLFQLPLGDVPVAFDFKFVHNTLFCFVFRSCSPPT